MALLRKRLKKLGTPNAPTNATEAAVAGVENEFAAQLKMPRPTDAPPGSPRKVQILAKRMEAGQQLHHPRDFQDFEDSSEMPTSSNGARK